MRNAVQLKHKQSPKECPQVDSLGTTTRHCDKCSVDRTGLIWSYFLVLVKTLAAVFLTICSLFIKHAEKPTNKALQ